MLHGWRASNWAITGLITPPPPVKAFTRAWLGTLAIPGRPPFSRQPSYATNQKVLSFTSGPPSDPPYWLLWKVSCGTGLPVAGSVLVLNAFLASSALLRKY